MKRLRPVLPGFSTASPLKPLLLTFSWQELRHHPWRNMAAAVAVMLGVALAFSVHLINASALAEFSQAVRAVNGQPDLELRAVQGSLDEKLLRRVASQPGVRLASPVLEIATQAIDAKGQRQSLQIIGIDALSVAPIAPALLPQPAADADRFAFFAPGLVFLNPAAQRIFVGQTTLSLQSGAQLQTAQIAGSVAASGGALAVMDIGAAQDFFGLGGQLSRIDVQLVSGATPAAFLAQLGEGTGLAMSVPGDGAERISNLSRAYRVNLTVLALVALFTGAFLVFSVLSLSVAKRAQQFALLGVLGLTGQGRLRLVLAESLLLGAVGSALGIALGTALAALALRLLGGDLGGGYFSGVAPNLQFSSLAALGYGLLGIATAGLGGWWPARQAGALPPAQTLKGLGTGAGQSNKSAAISVILIAAGAGLSVLPPVFGIALAAYGAVALLLLGGIMLLPWLALLLYDRVAPLVARRLLPLLAVERARRVRESAAIAVSGVVASLSLAVALTVMVASFRDSVTVWLDAVLPADLYVRAGTGSSGSSNAVYFSPEFVPAVAQLPGVARTSTLQIRELLLEPSRPSVALIGRPLVDADGRFAPASVLPMVGAVLPVPFGMVGVYASEAMVALYGAELGQSFEPLAKTFKNSDFYKPSSGFDQQTPARTAINSIAPKLPVEAPRFFVAGIWRDYARQSGALVVAQADFERLLGDNRSNNLAVWLDGSVPEAQVQTAMAELASRQAGVAGLVDIASTASIRVTSLAIFDRSFAVTYWLQGVAIAIGLFGVAASFSAQVLARQKEFGLLAHLGLTRRQILTVVAGEGAAWTLIGSVAGIALGLAVSMVLVFVVNPQSFHWTMDLKVPAWRLLALGAAVVVAGTLTAWLAGRAAAGQQAVLAVRQDW